jgi:2-polyprenyl-3-methyl-5-hydroxy-6-metoxy-1,4-benzoquinol methylase
VPKIDNLSSFHLNLFDNDMKNLPNNSLKLNPTECCICETDDAKPVGMGEDFEYLTSNDTFLAMQCNSCSLVYLNPRPDISEFETLYPPIYHAFDFSEQEYGIVHKIRSRLEANRALSWCKGLPADARILDVGCGDGFHLKLLKEYGKKSWVLEGVDLDRRAVEMALKSGLDIHLGSVETVDLPKNAYDLVFMVQTIEHVEGPVKILETIKGLLRPGGKLVIVTDNTDALDFKLFKDSYWGGYHFPRHWNLFNRNSIFKLAEKVGFEVADFTTVVSPVNWVYSIRNALVDWDAPSFLINQLSLKTPVSLSVFTLLDIVLQKFGRGALLRAILQKPKDVNGG